VLASSLEIFGIVLFRFGEAENADDAAGLM
jgi:hypothetical protein